MNDTLQVGRSIRAGVVGSAAVLLLCGASYGADSTNKTPVTFAKDVALILQAKCQDCHRAGSMAPMSLITYEEVRPWAKAIKERVSKRQMPPWHIDKTVGVQGFKNDMSLSDEQIATIVAICSSLSDMSFLNFWTPTVLSMCHGGICREATRS